MKDFMVDIESFGTGANGLITSVAFVPFDAHKRLIAPLEDSLICHVQIEDAMKHGATIEPRTVLWWMEQDKEPISRLVEGQKKQARPEKMVCQQIQRFIRKTVSTDQRRFDPKVVDLWGNGARFDIGLLDNMFGRHDVSRPYTYATDMCYRTLYKIIREYLLTDYIKLNWYDVMPEEAVQHDPYWDSVFQIKALFNMMDQLGVQKVTE